MSKKGFPVLHWTALFFSPSESMGYVCPFRVEDIFLSALNVRLRQTRFFNVN